MVERQSATHLVDELAQQRRRVAVGLADHLEPVAGRPALAQLERIDRQAMPEQPHAKPEPVPDATRVDHGQGHEVHMRERVQTEAAGQGLVEAAETSYGSNLAAAAGACPAEAGASRVRSACSSWFQT